MGLGLRTALTAVCLQTMCNSFSRVSYGRDTSSTAAFFTKELHLNNEEAVNRNLVSYCTSIDRTEAEQQINKIKAKPQRFIHPQVQEDCSHKLLLTENAPRHPITLCHYRLLCAAGVQNVSPSTISRKTRRQHGCSTLASAMFGAESVRLT